MAYKDDEEKRREAQARKAASEEGQRRREELLAQSAAATASQKATASAQTSTAKTAQKTAAQTDKAAQIAAASRTETKTGGTYTTKSGYQKKNYFDNDMNVVAQSHRQKTYDVSKLSQEEAMGIATRIVSDTDRDAFLKAYRKSASNKKSANYQENLPTLEQMRETLNAQKPGGLYQSAGEERYKAITEDFERDYTIGQNMKALSGLHDANGNAVNINTADYTTVVQGIRSIADETKRKDAIASLKTLVKTQGSRFYGQTVDDTLLSSYLGSPDFTQDTYEDWVERYDNAFYPQDGHEEENQSQYLAFAEEIADSGYSADVQRQFTEKLNEAYQNSTGKAAPDVNALREEQAGKEAEAEQEAQQKEKSGGAGELIKKAIGALFGAGEEAESALKDAVSGRAFMDEEWLREHEKEQEEEGTQSVRAPLMSELPGYQGAYASATVSDVTPKARSREEGESEAQGPVQQGTQGEPPTFEEWVAAGSPTASTLPTAYNVKDIGDVVNAYFAGKLSLVDDSSPLKQEFVEQYEKSPTFRQVMGTIADEDAAAQVEAGNYGGEQAVYSNMAALGAKGYDALMTVMGENYPEELRGDGYMILAGIGYMADQLAENGQLVGSELEGNMTRLLEASDEEIAALDPQTRAVYEKAQADYAAIFSARDELLAQQEEMRALDEENSRLALEEARAAVKIGQASDAQRQLVEDNAPDLTHRELMKTDAGYRQVYEAVAYWDDGYFAEGGEYETSDVYRARGVKSADDDSDYRYALSGQMQKIAEKDAETAHSLGMSLDDYYKSIGGVSMNSLCTRAAAAISNQGKTLTEEEIETLSTPTGGDGIGAGNVIGLGTAHAANSLYASYANTLYIGMSEANVIRAAGNMQTKYQSEYGILGREMYRQDIAALLDSGKLDENYANVLRQAMDEAGDVYQLGIDPEAYGFVRDTGAIARDNAKLIETYIGENATEGEQYWWRMTSNVLRNAGTAAVAMGVTALTGNAQAGFITGYSAAEWGDNISARYAEGYGRYEGRYLGTLDTLGSYAANMGTFEKIAGSITSGAKALFTGGIGGAMQSKAAGAAKAIAALKKYAKESAQELTLKLTGGNAGKLAALNAAKAFVGNILDEAAADETKEKIAQRYIDQMIAPLYQKTQSGETVGAAEVIGSLLMVGRADWTDPVGLINDTVGGARDLAIEVASGFTEAALSSALFAVAGAAGTGAATYKGVKTAQSLAASTQGDAVSGYESVKLAQEIASGQSTDVEGFIAAYDRDSKNPAFVEAFNAAAKKQMTDQTVATLLATDDGSDGMLPKVRQLTEQADSHAAAAAANRAAMEQSTATMDEAQAKIDAGQADDADVQMLADAAEAYAKNRTGYEEHTREEAQKRAEAKETMDKKMDAVRTQAAQQTLADTARTQAAIAQNREAAMADTQAQMAELEAQEQALEEEMLEAAQSYSDAAEMGMDEQTLEQLEARMEEVGGRIAALDDKRKQLTDPQAYEAQIQAEEEAARQEEEAQTQAQSQAERERVESEIAELAPAVNEVTGRSAKKIYLNDTQKAEVLHYTGLRTISQVNSQYGTKFRVSMKGDNVLELDGSTYTEIAQKVPGRMDAQSAHPETAILQMLDRANKLRGELNAMQASVGEAGAESYLSETTSRGTLDPVTQKLAGHLKQKTGLELIVTPLADNVRGLFDRESGRLILSSRLGAGETLRQVVMHELTHFIENTKGYAAYEDAALEAAYKGDMDAMERDAQELRETYSEAGVPIDAQNVHKELVAAATEKLMDALGAWGKTGSETLVYDLLGEKQSLPIRLYNKLTQYLARRNARKSGDAAVKNYEALVTARDNLKAAIAQAGQWQRGEGSTDTTVELDSARRSRGQIATDSEQTQMQYSLVDVGEMGKGVYESNFDPDTPKETKQKRLIELWQDAWSQNPIELNIKEADGTTRAITANFDPDYDITNTKMTDLGKVMTNRNGSSGDRTVTLNLADDLYDLARTSEHLDSEAESGKTGATHAGVKKWHYFFNDIIYRGENGDIPYTVWLDVKEKSDGGYVYQLYAKKTKKRETALHPSDISRSTMQESPSVDTSVADASTDVKNYSTQDGAQYSVGLRQFGNKTAQALDTLTDQTKDMLKGTQYEAVTNREQVKQANADIDARGLDTVVSDLVSKGEWTADDHAKAAVALVRAENEGMATTAWEIANAFNTRGTDVAQALQARKVVSKLTASGALVELNKKVRGANRKKGVLDGDIPTGNQAPVKEGKLPETLEKAYTKADSLKSQLDSLPGDVSYDNPWNLPLNDAQMKLVDEYKLRRTKLAGDTYSQASLKQRMLAAIVATPNNVRGDGLLTLCQQLEAMKAGYAVVTEADLNYINGQMSTFLYAEGPDLEGMPVTTEGKTALQRVYNAQANTIQAGALEKFNTWGYTNMLSSTKTWSKNITSNLLIRPLELASEKIGGAIEKKLITPKTGNRTTDAPNKAERQAGKEAFVGEIGQTMVDYFITHADTGHSSRFDLNRNNRAFNPEALQAYKNIVDFAMQVGDRPFWEQCYTEELAVIKRLGMKTTEVKTENGREVRVQREMTEAEMQTEAAVRATERVFQEDNKIVNAINKARAESPAVDFAITTFMPFLKTPTNVAGRMTQYSPVGLARTILQYGLWDGETNGGANFDQRRFVMNLGRGLTGTGLALAVGLLAAMGFIQPGREDEENSNRSAIRKALGESYSTYLKIGDMEIPLDFAQPASGPLYIGAKVAFDILDMGEDIDAVGVIGSVLYGSTMEAWNQIFNNSFLSGLSDLFRGYNDAAGIVTNIAEGIAENTASRLTPSAIRALAKATDPYVRDTASQNMLQQFFNEQIAQNWPLLRQTLPIKTDLTGDKMLQSSYFNWGQEQENATLHMLNAFVTPWSAVGEKSDAALDELMELSYTTGETSFLPKELVSTSKYEVTITKTQAKKLGIGRTGLGQYEAVTLALTDEEKRTLNTRYGDVLFNGSTDVDGLRSLTASKDWARMSEEEKINAVGKMKTAAKELVLKELVQQKKKNGEL